MRPVGFDGAFANDDDFVCEGRHAQAMGDGDDGDVALAARAAQSGEQRCFRAAIESRGAFIKNENLRFAN